MSYNRAHVALSCNYMGNALNNRSSSTDEVVKMN